ncbi:MAG: ABC transporter permease [Chloroflexi bacterium]|nr:ABC transporter permease [Chloroflexota bacterium]
MTRYIVLKLLWMVPVLWLVGLASFMLIQLIPGDPVDAMLGQNPDPQAAAQLRAQLGLDQPLHIQYGRWLNNLVHGDLGRSTRSPYKTADEIKARLLPSIELLVLSMVAAWAVGLPLGVYIGRRPGSLLDLIGTTLASVGMGTPNFLLGIIMIYFFALKLDWLSPVGYISPFEDLGQNLKLMVMPVLATSTTFLPSLVQQTRSAVLEVYDEMFIRTARAKGLAERQVLSRHALKIVLFPLVTLTGLRIGAMFGAGVITETLFAIPGMGRLLVDSVAYRDITVVQSVTLLITATVLFANLAVDVLYVYLDPRVKYG